MMPFSKEKGPSVEEPFGDAPGWSFKRENGVWGNVKKRVLRSLHM